MTINQLLQSKTVIFDGAMGTLLQQSGLQAGQYPESFNFSHPEIVEDIHKRYIASGVDIITANSFGANSIKLKNSGFFADEAMQKAVQIAKKAANGRVLVAADIGPTGKLLKPFGDLDFEDAVLAFSSAAKAASDAGADLILIETMTDLYEIKAAVLGVKESTDLPVIATMAFDEKGTLLGGGDIESAVCLLEGLRVDALGLNCGAPADRILQSVKRLVAAASVPVIINANAGIPSVEHGKTGFALDEKQFADCALEFAKAGVRGLGGCCGTTPKHISAIKAALDGFKPKKITQKNKTTVCSYGGALTYGENFTIIGERLNPTGKPLLKQAIKEKNYSVLCREAVLQEDAGANALDINVGVPGIDEPEVLQEAVKRVQEVCFLPLVIDSSNYGALEKAVRIYNGKPIINSVNGKLESLTKVLPIAKKYGAAVIALALDENGIPENPRDRVRIIEKIIKTAEEYGINRKDIIADCLTLAAAADKNAAFTTVQAVGFCRKELKINTVLGVSNISFGLPEREKLNSAFLAAAISNGLTSAIMNPSNQLMKSTIRSAAALFGQDEGFAAYTASISGETEQKTISTQEISLEDAVEKGLKTDAATAAAKLLKTEKPLDIINNRLVPALDRLGTGFENGSVFLPRLLSGAEAATEAFAEIKKAMPADENKKGMKIVIATVLGDIHDIGKNIVRTLLENYGFEVIDLGKDVKPELIKKAVCEQNVPLVGLSALMTTTLPAMEKTIKLLRENCDCKIMVGGAVLTEKYAKEIGADFYAKDAMTGVRFAKSVEEGTKCR